ncbi:Putative sodium calcium exchanger [Ectocarpus siliculosus]|uniref:Sodium calcium exchanger n=1 Tax=Ectocarpus siliculosus TaxID=2880 RepID=D8LRU1_ECTSI|nr:Putative sodium calcium exchanger [Ectocarpus siliculosus]|eukprot:CBN73858.1 Putative sodium calcium exchanger [Ectocarpus siliculosus]
METLLNSGVTGSPQVSKGGKLMMITSISYFIIQGPAFFLSGETDAEVSAGESGFALAGLITCTVLFAGYLFYQWELSRTDSDQVFEDYMEEVRREKIMNGEISLLGVMQAELRFAATRQSTEEGYQSMDGGNLALPEIVMRRLEKLLRPFFDKYDDDNSGQLDRGEFWSVFHDLQEHVQTSELNAIFEKIDTDQSDQIDFDEFVTGVAKFVLEKSPTGTISSPPPAAIDEAADDGDSEEHEEMPEDLAHLKPEEQQYHVKMRAAYLMTVGTALVLIFSDPMVDVLGVLGDRTGISSFYISFVLAPLASNASELIAAFNYSLKKTSRTIVISFAALQGAACMNNTFCLGVFMFLIYFRNLAWEFSAETVTILLVQVAMAVLSLRNTFRVVDGVMVLSLYPLSLMVVAGLEACGWD